MDAREVEQILRRVVREELSALLQLGPVTVRPEAVEPPGEREHPFLLSDAELEQAERLLAEDERPILRMRVMAARLEKRGQRGPASRMRKKADNMERRRAG